jgi:sugar phosphate isomerase/epimerase
MKFSILAADIPLPSDFPFPLRGSFDSCARLAAELGYSGIELQIRNPLDYDYKAVRKMLDRYGIAASAVTTGMSYTFDGHSMSSRDAAVRAKTVERLKRQLDFAKALDSQVLIGFLRGRRELGETDDEFEDLLSDSMNRTLEYAEKIDGTVCFEQINKNDGDLYNTTAETLRFIKKFNTPRLVYNADTYHMVTEEKNVTEAIKASKGYLTLFHVSDPGRLLPDDKHFDFYEAAKALREINYDGWVSIECKPLPDGETVARRGIEYLRRVFIGRTVNYV